MNNTQTILSIITCVYNGEKYIESCIKNVIFQQCSELEHIIIDGLSQDATVKNIKTYAEKYKHIRWVSEPDQGQSDAINKGIKMAKGSIIGILNVDDFYEPNVLNEIKKMFQSLPEPSLVVGKCNVWKSVDKVAYIYTPRSLKLLDLLTGQKYHPTPVNPSAYFYHRSLHSLVGFYDTNENYAMDFDFLYRAIPSSNIVKTNKILGNFRYTTHTKTYQNIILGEGKKLNENIRKKYIEKLNFKDKIRFRLASVINYFDLIRLKIFWRSRKILKQFIQRTNY
jgi:glycosyltransferase involved in cell wall biosynthesis